MEKALNVDIRQFYREDLGVHSEELLDKLEAVSQASLVGVGLYGLIRKKRSGA